MMLKKTLTILSFAAMVFSCTNDVPKPENQAMNQEKNIQGGENVAIPEITPDMFQEDITTIESFSLNLENKIKELDTYISNLTPAKANQAQPFLEELQSMQERSIGMNEFLTEIKPTIEAIVKNPEAYQNAGNVDGGPLQVQSAFEEMKEAVEELNGEIARCETEIRKIGG